MITYFVLSALLMLLSTILWIAPTVTELPFGTDTYIVQGVGGVKHLFEFFPPLETLYHAFLIYLLFRVSMLILKIFLGSRTPQYE